MMMALLRPHLPFPHNRHRFGCVACEDHVVALGQDQALRPNVHFVFHCRLVLPQVDPGRGFRVKVKVGNSDNPICVSPQ